MRVGWADVRDSSPFRKNRSKKNGKEIIVKTHIISLIFIIFTKNGIYKSDAYD